jgi:predicted anti-sigma-YlaC factor YlaD
MMGWARALGRATTKLLTLKCQEAAELVSSSMDGELSAVERWAVRLHLLICRACRRYRRQIQVLRKLLEDAKTQSEAGDALPGESIPQDLQDRLRAMLEGERS